MMEMTIKVEAPALTAAIEKLAAAITPPDPNILTPDEPRQPVVVPVTTAVPTQPPVTTSAPVPVAQPAASDPAPAPAPAAPVTPAPTVPVTAPTYTLDQIAKAGAALVDAGKMEQLLALLGKHGVAAVTQLSPEQYGEFATELRALGAQI